MMSPFFGSYGTFWTGAPHEKLDAVDSSADALCCNVWLAAGRSAQHT